LVTGLCLSLGAPARADTFTYQGQLKQLGAPINSSVDIRFQLFDNPAGGSQIGSTLVLLSYPMSNGLVTADLDFGPASINGAPRYLQVQVRSPSGSGSFTALTPRQPLTPTPYALFAFNGNPGPQGPPGPPGGP